MKVFNVALCAYGMSGKVFHAPFIQLHEGFNLYAVWERTKKTAAKDYPHICSFDTYESMLRDEAIDIVIVNTPNYTHFDFAKAALLAGKHVLVEKSFTVTVEEAKQLILLSAEKNKKITVYQNRRFDSDFKTVKKIISSAVLGKIVEAEIHFDRFNVNLSPKQHKETTNPGSGLLHDLGPHIIDQALQLFGMPTAVFGFMRVQRPLSIVNDYVDAHLFYPGLTVRIKAGLIVKEQPPAYSVHGTQGSFIKMRADIQEEMLKAGMKPGAADWGTEPISAAGTLHLDENGKSVRSLVKAEQGNYMEFFDQLHEALLYNKPLPVTGDEAINVMKIIDAIQQSHKTKETIALV